MRKSMVYSVILLVILFSFRFIASAQNFVVNGNLETWTAGLPNGWGLVENITQEISILHGGLSSAKHTSTTVSKKFNQEIFGIVEGQEYTISFWYYDNVTTAKTRIWSYWLSGATTLPDNPDVLRPSVYSTNNSAWQNFNVTLTAPVSADGFRFEVRIYQESGSGGGVYYDDFEFNGNIQVLPEPTNYPTNFSASAIGLNVNLTWTDALGTQLPSGYIIMAGLNSSLPVPLDGLPVQNDADLSDGSGAINTDYGLQEALFNGIQSNTTYYFTIYPYTNYGPNIDFKTNGTAPSANTTSSDFIIIESENFNISWGNWTPISVIGDQIWDRNNTFGIGNTPCPRISGFSGGCFENDDWLISPTLNLDYYNNEILEFYNARNYIGPDLECLISTNYDGGGDPYSATWSPLSFILSTGIWSWTSSGLVDLSSYNGSACIAFHYISNTLEAASWEVDNINIYGEIAPEPSNYPTDFTAVAHDISIDLTWTDAIGTSLPDQYILFAGINSNLPVPVDGFPILDDPDLSDGSAVLNIPYGVQEASFGNLPHATAYYFTIYPYTNSNLNVDYKTNGIVPSTQTSTSSLTNTLNIKVFLEGPFNGSNMNTDLNALNLISLNQPYDVEPWNYSGTEQVVEIPNTDIVDWVLVELRETTGDAASATPDKMINRQAAFLKADGSIVGMDGSCMITYAGAITSNLYVIIWHRNHLAIMSSAALTNASGIYSWDFSDQIAKAYLDGQKDIGSGKFGMIGGDSNSSGMVLIADIDPDWQTDAGKQGYFASDLNLDSQVNNIDKNEIWENNEGLAAQLPWECGTQISDIRNDSNYNTVHIGNHCWMAENLNIGTMIQNTEMANNGIIEKYCYNNLQTNCDVYGGLYQWNEMMQYNNTPGVQGICPPIGGWHLPTDSEWTTLTTFLGGENIAGGKMKTTGTLEAGTGLWYAPNTGATNESGFTALPGSGRPYSGIPENLGILATFWSSTEWITGYAWNRLLFCNSADVQRFYNSNGGSGYSVRCVKDVPTLPSIPSDPLPQNGSTNQPTNTTLSWTCIDPLNLPIFYDVFFGQSNPPGLVSSGQSTNTFNPGNLAGETIYYWKVNAYNDVNNISESDIWNFQTGASNQCLVQSFSYGGQTYNTVSIGTQCWMAENLNIGTMIPGTTGMADNSIIEKYCYANSTSNCDIYGGLYQWNEMMQYVITPGVQGICPTNWHLPTDAEWTVLTDWLGGESIAGGKLKSTGTIEDGTGLWYSPNTGATNESGFTALPGGDSETNGSFAGQGNWAYFWPSTESGTFSAHRRLFYYNYTGVYRQTSSKDYGFSVRCVQD